MFLHVKSFILSVSLVFVFVSGVIAQAIAPQSTPAKDSKAKANQKAPAVGTAEQVVEVSLVAYAGFGGINTLKQIRKTAIERGKIITNNADGTTETAIYEMRTMRGENLEKEKVRFDQEYPSSRFALLYTDNKVVGLFNESVFTPREEASKGFQNQIWRSIDALLRYKENGSTIVLAGKEKFMGAEYNVIDLTDKNNRKTRFFVSSKLFRVMWLEFTEDDVKYQRKFYDYRDAQGTLVPYRNVLFANGKQIEETIVSTITYGQKLDEALFRVN